MLIEEQAVQRRGAGSSSPSNCLLLYLKRFECKLSERIAYGKKELMALELHIGRRRDIGLINYWDNNVGEIAIRLEGIESTLGDVVLIGHVEVPVLVLVAQTAGNAMGGIPVGIVGGR